MCDFPTESGWWLLNLKTAGREGEIVVYVKFDPQFNYPVVTMGGYDFIIANIDDRGNLLIGDQSGKPAKDIEWKWVEELHLNNTPFCNSFKG